MESLTLAFPVSRDTWNGVKKWANGAASNDGGYTIIHYKTSLSRLVGHVTKQDWTLQRSQAGNEIIMVYTEADNAEAVRNEFLGRFAPGIEMWCKEQLHKQSSPGIGDEFSTIEVINVYPGA